MNLGFRESVVIVSAKLFGVGTVIGALVAIIDRILTMVCIVILAPIWSYLLSKDFKIEKERLGT